MSFIETKNLTKKFGDHLVLNPISLSIQKGEFVSVIGASGSGKSTLLRLFAGLEKPTSGEILFQAQPRLSFVFQEACLLPWKTVEENVALPFELLKSPNSNVENVLELVGLAPFKKFFPHELSGGMKMRVSIARALATNPEILLLDEPFAALDEVIRYQLQDELLKICAEKKVTTVFVTHSISEAVYMSNRVLVLDKNKKSVTKQARIEFSENRNQKIKGEFSYNAYVTELSGFLREGMS
jgi:NitT/TauT family transport system ATP-binding protein